MMEPIDVVLWHIVLARLLRMMRHKSTYAEAYELAAILPQARCCSWSHPVSFSDIEGCVVVKGRAKSMNAMCFFQYTTHALTTRKLAPFYEIVLKK